MEELSILEEPMTLEECGKRLAVIDTMIVNLILRRMQIAETVGDIKRKSGQKIFRASIEDKRLARIRKEALRLGLNPHMVASILYTLINESCKLQMDRLQSEIDVAPANEDELYETLKRNLLRLTEQWSATYDQSYDKSYFATKAYLAFEADIIQREIRKLADRGIAVDLGCATGRISFQLGQHFEHTIGYDLSPHMIAAAHQALATHEVKGTVNFEQVDVEGGIPLQDNSVSFVVMNLGTASDVRDLNKVFKEIMRVLVPGGRFLLSFYNRDALLYRWELLPWPTGLVAAVNTHKHCLEVHSGKEILSIYARPYTTTEVTRLLTKAKTGPEILTYPTVSSILPNDLFSRQRRVQGAVVEMDRSLATANMGAYIVATGQKPT